MSRERILLRNKNIIAIILNEKFPIKNIHVVAMIK